MVVKPVGRGRRVPPAERAEIWLSGADAPLDVAAITPVGDPEMALLAAAHAATDTESDVVIVDGEVRLPPMQVAGRGRKARAS